VITLFSLFFALLAAICCAFGRFQLSFPFLILSGLSDIFDGQVARGTHHTTAFGALLDSTIDRFNESAILIGISIHFLIKNDIMTILSAM